MSPKCAREATLCPALFAGRAAMARHIGKCTHFLLLLNLFNQNASLFVFAPFVLKPVEKSIMLLVEPGKCRHDLRLTTLE